ncbi:MAG: hypothetical protein NC916_01195 [Candidatus Omnitrophica bacterium]|nr:hypothetical protein [Candidatus Omnitrophota bacterium]
MDKIICGYDSFVTNKEIEPSTLSKMRKRVGKEYFKKFEDDFELIGGHLSNASKKYNEARNKLDALNEKLSLTVQNKQIETKEENAY